MFGYSFYRFQVGDIVHLFGNTTFVEVQWRGYLLLGPAGQRHRVAVYWLGELHWDCHYEDEIISIGQLPFYSLGALSFPLTISRLQLQMLVQPPSPAICV